MDNRQARTLRAFEQVLEYLTKHPITPEPPLLAEARAVLIACVGRITELSLAQAMAVKDMRGHVEHHRDALRRARMMPLRRIALRQLRFTAAGAALSVPHKRADARTVAEAALRMADALEPHQQLLDGAGVAKDFLAKMRREAHALQLTARRSEAARNRRSLATRDMAREFAKAMETLTTIEGIVMLHHGTGKHNVRLWRWSRRVQKRVGRPRARKRRGGDQMTA